MRGSPKLPASRPLRSWSAITTIIITASLCEWDRDTTGTTIIIIIIIIIAIIIIAGIDTKHIGHPVRMPNIYRPARRLMCAKVLIRSAKFASDLRARVMAAATADFWPTKPLRPRP
jgi:hypothetical protein